MLFICTFILEPTSWDIRALAKINATRIVEIITVSVSSALNHDLQSVTVIESLFSTS